VTHLTTDLRAPHRNTKDLRRAADAGFTLLELLVVIAILGLLVGLVAPVALRQLGSARTSIAQQSIERLGSILEMYKLDVGSFPTTEQGLQALLSRPATSIRWNGPYVKGDNIPLDSWGRPYLYRSPSTRPGRDYDLCSKGPNGDAAENSTEIICNAS
jgi:general secretion pathway protein G